MPSTLNPYTAGDPVGKTPAFIGRDDVLREVMRVLRHPTNNAITLFGQRRIGKTSVLQYLEKSLPKEGDYFPIYLDLMGKAGFLLVDILVDIARTIASTLDMPQPDLSPNPKENFRKTFIPQALKAIPEKASLVLLLDEFDVLADPQSEKRTKKVFFEYLRTLRHLDKGHLQFIFVLGRNMDDLDIVAQSLFKDLPSKRVSLLDEKDSRKVIQLSEENNTLTWSEEAITRVWELTAGHPYLTQAICSQVWEDAYDLDDEPAPVEVEAVEEAISETLERSTHMFSWLWNGLGPAEKVVASALAQAGPVIVDENRLSQILSNSGVRILIGELRDAPKILEEWDILAPANGGYRFVVELLRRWVEENKPLSRTQEELDYINPVADNYYQAALGHYRRNQLEEAIVPLQTALRLNPNHIRASELLGEILIAQDNLDEAQKVLETLSKIAPANAQRRLKQIYLQRAEATEEHTVKLEWLEKILALLPNDQDALQAKEDVSDTIRKEKFKQALRHIEKLEEERDYQNAYELALKTAKDYPNDHAWDKDIARLENKSRVPEKYDRAVEEIEKEEYSNAKYLLVQVISVDPDYKQVARYFYWATHKEKPVGITELAKAIQEANNAQALAQNTSEQVKNLKQKIKELESNKSTEPEGGTETGKNFSVWNPLNYFRLLWWSLMKPELLKVKNIEIKDLERINNRTIYFLIFVPIIAPLLGIALSLIPVSYIAWDASYYAYWAIGLLIASNLVTIGVNALSEKFVEAAPILDVLIGVGISIVAFDIITKSIAENLSGNVLFAISGISLNFFSIAFLAKSSIPQYKSGYSGLSFPMAIAFILTNGGAIELGIALIGIVVVLLLIGDVTNKKKFLSVVVTASLVLALLVGIFSGNWHVNSLWGSIASSVLYFIVFAVSFGAGILANSFTKKLGKWIFWGLILSFSIFMLLSFGGLRYLNISRFPTPIWPF